MTQKSNDCARDTLNALIAGGYFPPELLRRQKDRLTIDTAVLRDVEGQLCEYYKPKSPSQTAAPDKAPQKN